jgi:CRISPR-associated endonuclease/helicase Cas3
VQRLGRVNRRGERGDTQVVVVEAKPDKDKQPDQAVVNTKALLERLPEIDGRRNASPDAILKLREQAGPEAIRTASTPEPLRPALTRPLVEAWSMTSLEEHTGRPDVAPWLRGWVEEDEPQTAVLWRKHLPLRDGSPGTSQEVKDFFEAAPPHASELLETETWHVVDWLMARAAKAANHTAESFDIDAGSTEAQSSETQGAIPEDHVVAFALSAAGDLQESYRLRDLIERNTKEELKRELAGATLIVDARLGGLGNGLLDEKNYAIASTADDGGEWLADIDGRPAVGFRVTRIKAGEETSRADGQDRAKEIHVFELARSGDEADPERIEIETWTTEDARALSIHPQFLAEHQSWTERQARKIADAVGLTGVHRDALAIAARLHDEGKRAGPWKRAFRAPSDGDYAKTKGPPNLKLLGGYRHEFGSLPLAEKDADFQKLPPDLRDLVLHLIAAHHGFARPMIRTEGCEDAPPSALKERARDVALRFARMQKQWGPWGLAWWEALLRAADQQASRENDHRADAKSAAAKIVETV